MSEIINPHDRFFKDLLARPAVAADFLAAYLPPEVAGALDLTAPELVKDSFVDAELRQHFSDLLYRVRLRRGADAYVYVLFEHKSAPDEWVAFQVLRYLVRIWEQVLRETGGKLPPVVPLVLYHGPTRWHVARHFTALVEWGEAAALRKYVPAFEYHLCDLSAYREEDIRGAALLRVGLLILKYIFSGELKRRLPEILRLLAPAGEQSALEYLGTVLRYVSVATDRLTTSDLQEALATAFPEQGGVMPTIAETWVQEGIEKGLEKGRQEGLEKGKQEGSAAVMLRMLQRRFGPLEADLQGRVRALSFARLERLGEALLDFQGPADLVAWLGKHSQDP